MLRSLMHRLLCEQPVPARQDGPVTIRLGRLAMAMAMAVSMAMAMALLSGCTGSSAAAGHRASFPALVSAGRPAEVTVAGTVTRLLRDGHGQAGPHERFLMTVDGVRVEVDHNLTLAPRVPLRVGDVVDVRGQFEPDPGRPVIHYTHHATGNHPGGYIRLRGRTYALGSYTSSRST